MVGNMSKKVRMTVVLIALWTIVQTVFHVFWIIYAYLLAICRIKPTHYDVVFVYLTYAYKQSCGPIHLKTDTLFLKNRDPEDDHFPNETAATVLYRFLNDTLHKATLPEQSSGVTRTELYLVLMCITDLVWIASAIFLFVGTFYKTNHKYLWIIFYGPWLVCSGFINFLDVVASVHYGIDLIYIRSYTSWLKFIGVSNHDDFALYDTDPGSRIIPAMPTTAIVSLLSRVFVVWLINVICFFIIIFLAIPELALKTTIRPKSRFDTGGELNFNSSAARIRNWQLFYGAIEVNSTMASSSPGNSAETSAGTRTKDHNSNKCEEAMGPKKDSGVSNYGSYEKSPFSLSGFRRFSDVASDVSKLPIVDTNNISILKGHVPWSYISPEGHYVRKHQAHPAKVRHEDNAPCCTRL